jgi:hypothetical protein
MFGFLLLILFVVAFFKITGLMFRVIGKVLGCLFGIFGWLFLAGLAVTVFGLAVFAIPVILIIGGVALIVAAVS